MAPNFTAETTQGKITFHDWIGSGWAILFSHPKDFTPVCTTELGYMAGLKPEFDKRNCKIIGLSVDPVADHQRWSKDIEETQGHAVTYPMIGDPELKVAMAYDMLPEGAGTTSEGRTAADNATVRSVFVVGPDKKVKAMLTYPMSTGRNFDEVLRLLDSCQLTATHKVATPVNWKQGQDVIIVPAVSDEDAKKTYPAAGKPPSPTSASCRSRVTDTPTPTAIGMNLAPGRHPALDRFIADAHAVIAQHADAADRVTLIAPLMRQLLEADRGFLQPHHYRSDPQHYERNAIHISPDGNLSLFALVWLPGQWTPVHDHGSWGVVGIVQGLLEERSLHGDRRRDHGEYRHPSAPRRGSIAQSRFGHQFRAEPGSYSHDRCRCGTGDVRQPAPVRAEHELVPHLRRWRRNAEDDRRAAPGKPVAAGTPAGRATRYGAAPLVVTTSAPAPPSGADGAMPDAPCAGAASATTGASATSSYVCQIPLGGRAQIVRCRVQFRLRRRGAARGHHHAGVGPVVDEAVGRVDAAELAALAEADAHRGPVIGLRDVHHRACCAATPPYMPGPHQLAWSTSTSRGLMTRLTTATWPRRIRPLERKVSTLPGSGTLPRA